MSNQTIYMIGDSIIDSVPYVAHNCDTVSVLMQKLDDEGFDGVEVQKWAVDGYTTPDVINQLVVAKRDGKIGQRKPNTVGVLSVGGNDALQARGVMLQQVTLVYEAFGVIDKPLKEFRRNYQNALKMMVQSFEKVIVFTIYNKIPDIVTNAEKNALSLFNDIITEEVNYQIMEGENLELLDLRVLCNDPADYSVVSPIEPSHQGSQKIVNALINKL